MELIGGKIKFSLAALKCRGAKLPCELSSSEVIFEKFSLDVENQFFIFEAIGADWTDWLGCLVMLKTHMCLKLPLLLIFYIFSILLSV